MKAKSGERTKTANSPGQIFLFGEHAVVYGQPALAAAIDIRTEAKAEPLSDNKFEVKSKNVGELNGEVQKVDGRWSIRDKSGDLEKLRFVTKVAELTFDYLDKGKGLKLHIKSDVPPGAGLGSSSAVTASTAAAISSAIEENLNKDEISQLAYDAEVEVQGAASRTGVNVATYGGFIKVREDEMEELEDLPELDMLIGCTGKYGNTGELVAKVRRLKESHPKIIEPIVEAIGKSAEVGIESLRESHLKRVGALMNTNQNLLEGLGVSSPELRNLIQTARNSGAIGAKLTGAGGGGCMIALGPDKIDEMAEAIEEEGGKPMKAKIGVQGLRYQR